MNWTINQTVDLSRGYTPVVWPDALMVSGDVGAHTWRLTVLDNGVPADLSGATVTGSFLRADGATVQVAGSVLGNVASVTLTDACYAVEGKLVGTMRAVISGATVTLAAVVYTVKLLTSGDVVNPGVTYHDFTIDASPAGTYANLAALIADDPDHSKIYITLDDGKWCYWNGSAFVAGGVYQALMGVDRTLSLSGSAADAMVTGHAIDNIHTDLLSLSPYTDNLYNFDASQWEIGGVYAHTGEETTSVTAVRTGFVWLMAGDVLRFDARSDKIGMRILRYDQDRAYVGANSAYAKLYTADQDEYVRIMSRYEPSREIDDVADFGDIVKKIRKKAKPGVDSYVFGAGYALNFWRIGGIYVANGTLGNEASIANTELFYVRKGSKIVSKLDPEEFDGFKPYWYAMDGTYIGTTPSGAINIQEYVADKDYLMRVTSKYRDLRNLPDTRMFLDKIFLLPPLLSGTGGTGTVIGDLQTLYKSEPIDGMETGQPVTLSSRTHADLYAKYDALMVAYPNAITKRLLGHGTGANGLADSSLPIYEYVFAPPSTTRTLQDNTKKVLLVSGLHGAEKVSAWGMYEFFRQMYAQYNNSVMQTLAANICFVTIPCVNPGGFDANTRNNKNNVDINRNFSFQWADNTSSDKGTAPYSEQESQIVRDWLVEHKDWAVGFVDYHNTNENQGSGYLSTPVTSLFGRYSTLMRRLSVYWNGKHARTTNDAYGWSTTVSIPSATRESGNVAGIPLSATLEITYIFDGVYNTSETLEMAVEMLAGYLQLLLSMA